MFVCMYGVDVVMNLLYRKILSIELMKSLLFIEKKNAGCSYFIMEENKAKKD